MKRCLILCLLLAAVSVRAGVLSEPWPQRICNFPDTLFARDDLSNLPISFTKGIFLITISLPSDPALREEGGSGGPMLGFTIRNQRTGWKTTFYDQCVNGALLEPFNNRPQLEIWGRGGGGYFARELIRFTRGKYRSVRVDRFAANKDVANDTSETTSLPGDNLILYFIDSAVPENTELQGR
jgi:hypothetical protein